MILSSSKSKLELEWDCLLSVYSSLSAVGKIFVKKRINEIQASMKLNQNNSLH